jgi:hypothetical protein
MPTPSSALGAYSFIFNPLISIIFVTITMVTSFLICPGSGAFLFVLYTIADFLCHRFMPGE